MCGIAGFVGAGEHADVHRMIDVLAHRGPDGEGVWIDQNSRVFFGHRRLSILDIAAGSQPMTTLDEQLVVTFNGEIYNHAELRANLEARGHRFKTDHCDTEVLLYGYREWGSGLLEKLNGMWSFAIYDRAKGEVFLSRDRFGKKPLFYYSDDHSFVFASELTALRLHPAVPENVDPEALQKFFAYGFIPAPWALLARVKKLPAGHWMKVSVQGLRCEIRKYWEFELDPFETIPQHPERTWGEELVQRLDEAVRCRLQADVPVGVFLSGGIDSTAIATLAARHHPSIETFSIGFEERSFDEREFARLGAETANTRHHEEVLSPERYLNWALATAGKLDEVMGDSSILPTALVSKLAREHVTVALSGDGSDELFAGYDPFRALKPARLYSAVTGGKVNRTIRALAERLPVSHANMSLDFKLKRMLRGLSYTKQYWLPAWMGPLDPQEIGDLFGSKPDPEELYAEAIAAWNHPSAKNDVDRTIQFYVRLYLQDDILVKTDRASMMHRLEARCPFLDINVVDFARRIPASYKLRGGVTKYILKEAVRGLIPDRIIDRPKKGFGIPIGNWFKNGDLNLSSSPVPKEMDWSWVNRRLADHRAGRRDDRAMLWCAWLLQHSPLFR
ncbi:MAG TPA: asparagine synthase (glutamine-hydrolyzing) [Chthoniobacterales bacterium]|jgi:asparagine synthase (glutamine-hydrolysing)|nr:asparagine synthase (glutamine-hydrolyzing) [Chthoniobacterales bacterium]